MAKAGWLPPWHEWFGETAMEGVIPDAGLRQKFVSELPRLPLALFEEPIPVFEGWPDAPCAYIQFGDVYQPEADEACESGWPTIRLEGGHLHMLVAPAAVTDAILELLSRGGVDALRPWHWPGN